LGTSKQSNADLCNKIALAIGVPNRAQRQMPVYTALIVVELGSRSLQVSIPVDFFRNER